MTATLSFLDTLAGIFQSAITANQQDAQLKAQNAQLTAANADLQTKLDAITSSLNEDESEKAETAAKLASLQQIVAQFQASSAVPDPNASATAPDPNASAPATPDPNAPVAATVAA